MNEVYAGFIPSAEYAPACSVDGTVAETAFLVCQRLLRGIGGMQAKLLSFFPDLKSDAAGIFVQQRRMFGFQFVDFVRCLDASSAASCARWPSSNSSNSSRASRK